MQSVRIIPPAERSEPHEAPQSARMSEAGRRESELRVTFQREIQKLRAKLHRATHRLRVARARLADRPEALEAIKAIPNPLRSKHRRKDS
ncbi:MAG: hypothetical protein IT428_06000 [Planctomycetaceae bacterium]|nr:hypothetical protein [Planctomycetaceae bacterium]